MYIGAFCKRRCFNSCSLCLLEQRADILHEIFQHQYLLVPTVLQLCSQVNLSLIKAAFPVFKHVYIISSHASRVLASWTTGNKQSELRYPWQGSTDGRKVKTMWGLHTVIHDINKQGI